MTEYTEGFWDGYKAGRADGDKKVLQVGMTMFYMGKTKKVTRINSHIVRFDDGTKARLK